LTLPAAPDNPNLATPELQNQGTWPPPSVSDFVQQRQAETASKLAAGLLKILAGGIFLHYVCILILIYLKRDDGLKVFEDLFHSWLPVVAGLAGGAVTYYFTKERK
jgi:hypothetical protein